MIMNKRIVGIIRKVYGTEFTEELCLRVYNKLWPLLSLSLEDAKYESLILDHKEHLRRKRPNNERYIHT